MLSVAGFFPPVPNPHSIHSLSSPHRASSSRHVRVTATLSHVLHHLHLPTAHLTGTTTHRPAPSGTTKSTMHFSRLTLTLAAFALAGASAATATAATTRPPLSTNTGTTKEQGGGGMPLPMRIAADSTAARPRNGAGYPCALPWNRW
ncbi:hypothetical protein L226DRAFT_538243 [Lentinus tigrinus ALCF2SS1-7]|uniref:uncharacterized protein n=1 Tax=Lentinus tigrinus ALCF2SS1-7 TaxID=1328758 RepID=UPI001165EA07|nr:hypothetical protein L226DRAFT_538243 [Lentinus tigrinus ALCF2SS1-7]